MCRDGYSGIETEGIMSEPATRCYYCRGDAARKVKCKICDGEGELNMQQCIDKILLWEGSLAVGRCSSDIRLRHVITLARTIARLADHQEP